MATKLKSNNLAGIWFWLKWIALAIGGFTVSVLFWNWLLLDLLGADFKSPHVAISWMAAVFGTWFVILIPLMKKKEKVMGHMDKQDETTVTWWLIWITLTIGSFFAAVWFWTPFIASRFGPIRIPTNALLWLIAVFGTWLVALIPLMIIMYYKVDKAYEDARIRREVRAQKFQDPVKLRAVFVDESNRELSKDVARKLKKVPQTIRGGHLITAILRDGRRIENVFVARGKELLGVYDQGELTFKGQDIVDFESTDLTHPPDFTEKIWLRLDGNSA